MLEIKTATTESACIALGYFDCLHEGHRKILSATRDCALKHGALCAMFTFYDDGFASVKGQSVFTYDEKVKLAQSLGVNAVIPFRFDDRTRTMDKRTFLDLLFSLVSVKAVCCGFDYTFGYKGEGNVAFLREYCAQRGVECVVVDCVCADGKKLAGKDIRQMLTQGKIEQVNRQLYTPYFVTGKVVHGKGIGKTFGAPTANLALSAHKLLPQNGVYATKTSVDGRVYRSVTNVGAKPTFADDTITVETLLADFDGNLYEKEVTVTFIRKLREITRFENAELLKEQILKDLNWEETPC